MKGEISQAVQFVHQAIQKESRAFPLAGMSRDIRIMTLLCLTIPVAMAIGVLLGVRALLIPVILIFPLYGWVWLLFMLLCDNEAG